MSASTWLNVGCGSFRAPKPWWNIDVIETTGIHPDQVVDAGDPLGGFATDSCERVYLGHVLEHVPWPEVPAVLTEVRRVLQPGGRVAVVGPDVLRTIERYRSGSEPWDQVIAALEEEINYQWMCGVHDDWPQARHWWNCHEKRVIAALEAVGFADVRPVPITPEALDGWPVVAYTQHQCAVLAVAP